MTQSQIDKLTEAATRGVRTLINDKPVDQETAYKAIESFMDAYREQTHERYHGDIDLGDLLRVLHAWTISKTPSNIFFADAAKKYFSKFLYRSEARTATFADYVSFTTGRAYRKMFNL